MSNDDATATTYRPYAVMVKGPNGRKWFRADSAQCADGDLIAKMATNCQESYPHLKFMASNHPDDIAAPTAPAKYRPWDTTPDADEVDLDALADDEL